ncbi:MAG TPA: hypothetical protein VGF48_06515 [Thermoanaerobaculia bacterium]|jgi:hypothetical protein
MQTREITTLHPNALRPKGAPRISPERIAEYVRLTRMVRANHAAAGAFFDALSRHPVAQWPSLLSANREVWNAQMLVRLAWAAGDIEEEAPAEALAMLDAGLHLAALIPPSSFAYEEGCLELACWRAAALADLGRFDEALAEIRNARRFVIRDSGRLAGLAKVLVERAYVHFRMGRHRHLQRMLCASLRIVKEFGLDRQRALRVLFLATAVPPAPVPNGGIDHVA